MNRSRKPIARRTARLALVLAALVGASPVTVPAANAQSPARPRPDQQVVLVTGSTGGLGREVARRLGSLGAHVIVHGRNSERRMALVAEIEREGKGSARFYAADFASFDQVREDRKSVV